VVWGSCVFDGTNTNCTVSGPFSGIGSGGTFNFVLTYPGNGPSPLTAISSTPGGDLVFFNLSSGSFKMTLAENNGPTVSFYDPTTFTFMFTTSSKCTGVSVCGVGLVGLSPNATISGPITGGYDPTPRIRASLGIISASDYGAFTSIAPGTWIEIYGTNLATTLRRSWGGADFNGVLAPTALSGTTVTIGGKSAFLDYVDATQINAQVPSGVASGPQPVVVTTAGGSSAPATVTVNPVEPGLLAPPVFRLAAGQYAGAVFPDAVTFVLPPNTFPQLPSRRARPGDTITFYGVGFGPVTPDIPAGQIVQQANPLQSAFQVSFAGTPATVSYAGLATGYLGLYQFNVVVPNVAASDAVPVTFTLGGASGTQTLLIPVQN
jgi:uncharacterized protein (TIGR03437 family)